MTDTALLRRSETRSVAGTKENIVQQIVAGDHVRLEEGVPELELIVGTIGRVVSTRFFPNEAYEVEFRASPHNCASRVLLLHGQVVRE
jgi:hypothetical protein